MISVPQMVIVSDDLGTLSFQACKFSLQRLELGLNLLILTFKQLNLIFRVLFKYLNLILEILLLRFDLIFRIPLDCMNLVI